MKFIKRIGSAVLGLSLLVGGANVMAAGNGHGGYAGAAAAGSTAAVLLPYQDLSEEETAGVLQMAEEEKLARDVYLYLDALWGYTVFGNIAVSEQNHMDAVAALLAKYGLANPVEGLEAGQFATAEMQELYDALVAQGSESLEQALQVGATIEDLDINDLEELKAAVDNEDILTVYANLEKGSRNHLRAFVSNLELLGSSYTAQFLTQEEVDAIVSSDWETGPVDANGNAMSGQGMGNRGGMAGARGAYYVDSDGDGVCDNLQL